MEAIRVEANYGICEAAKLAGIDRGTLRQWIQKFPKYIPVTFDPFNHRMLLSGETVIKIRDKKL